MERAFDPDRPPRASRPRRDRGDAAAYTPEREAAFQGSERAFLTSDDSLDVFPTEHPGAAGAEPAAAPLPDPVPAAPRPSPPAPSPTLDSPWKRPPAPPIVELPDPDTPLMAPDVLAPGVISLGGPQAPVVHGIYTRVPEKRGLSGRALVALAAILVVGVTGALVAIAAWPDRRTFVVDEESAAAPRVSTPSDPGAPAAASPPTGGAVPEIGTASTAPETDAGSRPAGAAVPPEEVAPVPEAPPVNTRAAAERDETVVARTNQGAVATRDIERQDAVVSPPRQPALPPAAPSSVAPAPRGGQTASSAPERRPGPPPVLPAPSSTPPSGAASTIARTDAPPAASVTPPEPAAASRAASAVTPPPPRETVIEPTPVPPAATTPDAPAASARAEVVAPPPEPAAPAAVVTPPSPNAAIQAVINDYRQAFNSLDAQAAKSVWPSVDERALDRAFGRLETQDFSLGTCRIAVTGTRAVATCPGTLRYVPKVGSESTQRAQWEFNLRRRNDDWSIEGVNTR